ncbi:MAG TPA: hypothetical protein VFV65_08025 [Gemmatimonadales bacterium]|nr:hypothetical protein [Gemmatimonadales bacterium]
MLPLFLALAMAGCDLTGLDLSGIDDWDDGDGGGGGWGGGGCCYIGTIRPVVSADIHLRAGSEFQLQALDPAGNPLVDPAGTFNSLDTTVLAVSPDGWAEARRPGSARILYGVGGGLSASTDFFVVSELEATTPRLELRGSPGECGSVDTCDPPGSPIVEGWIGHSVDIAGVRLTFIGADGQQPADGVTAAPVAVGPCQSEDDCVAVNEPSPGNLWRSGDAVLCFRVTVGDSVPEIGWVSPANAAWEVTWSRPGLFVLRQTVQVWVRPQSPQPTSVCQR